MFRVFPRDNFLSQKHVVGSDNGTIFLGIGIGKLKCNISLRFIVGKFIMLYVYLITGGLVTFLASKTCKTRVDFFVSLHKMIKLTK